MTEALTSGIGAAREELQLQCFCVNRHQSDSRRFLFAPWHPCSSASSARIHGEPISFEAQA